MENSEYVHLHVHSEYSQLDGLGKPDKYAQFAAEMEFPAIAITDHANVDGHIKWQKACEKAGIKPILGCELYIVPDMKVKQLKEKRGHLTVLVKNLAGWQALNKMITIANLEGFYNRPRIDYGTFLENVNTGMVVLTACAGSFLLLPGGEDFLFDLDSKGIQCYLEVMPHQIDGQIRINNICVELSQRKGLPLVATNDCHYIKEDQVKAHR